MSPDSTKTASVQENLRSVILFLLRDLFLALFALLILGSVKYLVSDRVRLTDGRVFALLEHWRGIADSAAVYALTWLLSLEFIVGVVRRPFTKLSRRFIERTLLSQRSLLGAALTYLGVLFGGTIGYALILEALGTQRGLAAKFCFYTASFVLLFEVILLGIRYVYRIAGERKVPVNAVMA